MHKYREEKCHITLIRRERKNEGGQQVITNLSLSLITGIKRRCVHQHAAEQSRKKRSIRRQERGLGENHIGKLASERPESSTFHSDRLKDLWEVGQQGKKKQKLPFNGKSSSNGL